MSTRSLIAFVIAGAVVFVVGRMTAESGEPSRIERVESRVETRPGATTIVRGDLSREDLRAVIRDELASLRPTNEPTEAVEPTAEAIEQQRSATESGQRVVEAAIAAGTWGATDAAQLRGALPAMSVEQQNATLQMLAMAVNAQKLSINVVPIL